VENIVTGILGDDAGREIREVVGSREMDGISTISARPMTTPEVAEVVSISGVSAATTTDWLLVPSLRRTSIVLLSGRCA